MSIHVNIVTLFQKLNVAISSIFGQTTGHRIYTVSREPIRIPEIQYPVFGTVFSNYILSNISICS